MSDLHYATAADIGPIAAMLARAFDDDPVWAHIFPDADRRPPRLERMFGALARIYLRHAQLDVATTDGRVDGAAFWGPPGHWRISTREMAPQMPAMARAIGLGGVRHLKELQAVERRHAPYAREPHWYLGVLGTDPPRQGTGVGSALLARTLARADEAGLGAYLESSKEANVPLYARHGFEVVGEHTWAGGGPTMFLMWRAPRG